MLWADWCSAAARLRAAATTEGGAGAACTAGRLLDSLCLPPSTGVPGRWAAALPAGRRVMAGVRLIPTVVAIHGITHCAQAVRDFTRGGQSARCCAWHLLCIRTF